MDFNKTNAAYINYLQANTDADVLNGKYNSQIEESSDYFMGNTEDKKRDLNNWQSTVKENANDLKSEQQIRDSWKAWIIK